MIWDTSLVNLGVIVCPPRILPIFSALMGRMLNAVPALLSSSNNTAVLCTAFQLPVQSTVLWGLPGGKLTPSQPFPRHWQLTHIGGGAGKDFNMRRFLGTRGVNAGAFKRNRDLCIQFIFVLTANKTSSHWTLVLCVNTLSPSAQKQEYIQAPQCRQRRHNSFYQILEAWSSCPHLGVLWHWGALVHSTWPATASLKGYGHLCTL